MGQVNLSDYKNIYLQTAKDYVSKLFLSYSKLFANDQDEDAINTVHICSHSLKSQSQVMGFTDIANLCENLERISSDILNKVHPVDEEFMNLLKKAVDELNLELYKIEKQQ